jgi:hypothetical protein
VPVSSTLTYLAETPPFNSNLPEINVGDIIEYIKNGKSHMRSVIGFDGPKGVLVSPPQHQSSPQSSSQSSSPLPPLTPGKVPINFIVFRFPPPPPCPPYSKQEQHIPDLESTHPSAVRIARSVAKNVPRIMWEALAKTHAQVTAQDAMEFLFPDLQALPRGNAMYKDVPILFLCASQMVLNTSTKYFTHKTAGKFECNTPELVAQIEYEEKDLQDDKKIQKFLCAGKFFFLFVCLYVFSPLYLLAFSTKIVVEQARLQTLLFRQQTPVC